MNTNTLFQSLDHKRTLTEDAKMINRSLDCLTSAIVGRLISERLVELGGQPGQVIEYLSMCVAETLVKSLDDVDTVELNRFWARKEDTEGAR